MNSSRQKIYFEASALGAKHISGVGHVMLSTLRAWASSDASEEYDLTLVVPYDKKRAIENLGLGLKTHPLPLTDRALRLLRKFDLVPPLDLICGKGVYIFPNYWNCRLLFSRSLTYVHDIGFKVHPEFVAPKNQKFLLTHTPRWLRRSNTVIAVSRFTKNELIKEYHLPEQKIEVVLNGVDTKLFHVREQTEVEAIKQKYAIDGNFLLYVGNIEPRKNILRLLHAYKSLDPQLREQYILVLAGGDGWNNQEIENEIAIMHAEGLKIHRLREHVPDEDLPALYTGAVALVHPAVYEGFGITPLEAMACGTPVVVSNGGSLPEVIGQAGLYVDAEKEADISDKIYSILTDEKLRQRLIQAGHSRANEYTWQHTIKQLVDCIDTKRTHHE